jgi:hypothetical protein
MSRGRRPDNGGSSYPLEGAAGQTSRCTRVAGHGYRASRLGPAPVHHDRGRGEQPRHADTPGYGQTGLSFMGLEVIVQAFLPTAVGTSPKERVHVYR